MLDSDLIGKMDQLVATFVEIATTTHFALYSGYINKGFSEEQAFELVCDYAIHHNSGLKDIVALLISRDEVATTITNEECEDDDLELDDDEL